MGGRDSSGIWNGRVHTALFKMNKCNSYKYIREGKLGQKRGDDTNRQFIQSAGWSGEGERKTNG